MSSPQTVGQDLLGHPLFHDERLTHLYNYLQGSNFLNLNDLRISSQIEIVKSILIQKFEAGATIFNTGEISSDFYFLLGAPYGLHEPVVHIFESCRGTELLRSVVMKGGYFGYEIFIDSHLTKRSFTVRASTLSYVACIPPRCFHLLSSFRSSMLMETRSQLLNECSAAKYMYLKEEKRLVEEINRLREMYALWNKEVTAKIDIINRELECSVYNSLRSATDSLMKVSTCDENNGNDGNDENDEKIGCIQDALRDLLLTGNFLAKKLEHERREDTLTVDASVSALQEKQRQDFEDEVSVLKSVEEEKKNRRVKKNMMKYLNNLLLQKDKCRIDRQYRSTESNSLERGKALDIIGAIIIGAIVRKRIRKYTSGIPHIVSIQIKNIITTVSKSLISPGESLYFVISVIGDDGVLYSRCTTATVSSLDSFSNTKITVCVNGDQGCIIFSIISRHPLRSDQLEGQAVLYRSTQNGLLLRETSPYAVNLSKLSSKNSLGEEFPVEIKLAPYEIFPLNDSIGNILLSKINEKSADDYGTLRLTVMKPSLFVSNCGWFISLQKDVMGDISFSKIWVVLQDGIFRLYSNTFDEEEGLKGEIKQLDIIAINLLVEIKVTGFKEYEFIESLGGFELFLKYDLMLTWAWTQETFCNRGMWLRIFSPNGT